MGINVHGFDVNLKERIMKLTKGRILALMTLLVGSVFGQNNPIQFTSVTANVEGSIQLKWTSESNALYRIEYATELSDSMQWTSMYSNYPSQGTNTLWMDAGVYYQPTRIEHPRY